jgi:hypothetical protein
VARAGVRWVQDYQRGEIKPIASLIAYRLDAAGNGLFEDEIPPAPARPAAQPQTESQLAGMARMRDLVCNRVAVEPVVAAKRPRTAEEHERWHTLLFRTPTSELTPELREWLNMISTTTERVRVAA